MSHPNTSSARLQAYKRRREQADALRRGEPSREKTSAVHAALPATTGGTSSGRGSPAGFVLMPTSSGRLGGVGASQSHSLRSTPSTAGDGRSAAVVAVPESAARYEERQEAAGPDRLYHRVSREEEAPQPAVEENSGGWLLSARGPPSPPPAAREAGEASRQDRLDSRSPSCQVVELCGAADRADGAATGATPPDDGRSSNDSPQPFHVEPLVIEQRPCCVAQRQEEEEEQAEAVRQRVALESSLRTLEVQHLMQAEGAGRTRITVEWADETLEATRAVHASHSSAMAILHDRAADVAAKKASAATRKQLQQVELLREALAVTLGGYMQLATHFTTQARRSGPPSTTRATIAAQPRLSRVNEEPPPVELPSSFTPPSSTFDSADEPTTKDRRRMLEAKEALSAAADATCNGVRSVAESLHVDLALKDALDAWPAAGWSRSGRSTPTTVTASSRTADGNEGDGLHTATVAAMHRILRHCTGATSLLCELEQLQAESDAEALVATHQRVTSDRTLSLERRLDRVVSAFGSATRRHSNMEETRRLFSEWRTWSQLLSLRRRETRQEAALEAEAERRALGRVEAAQRSVAAQRQALAEDVKGREVALGRAEAEAAVMELQLMSEREKRTAAERKRRALLAVVDGLWAGIIVVQDPPPTTDPKLGVDATVRRRHARLVDRQLMQLSGTVPLPAAAAAANCHPLCSFSSSPGGLAAFQTMRQCYLRWLLQAANRVVRPIARYVATERRLRDELRACGKLLQATASSSPGGTGNGNPSSSSPRRLSSESETRIQYRPTETNVQMRSGRLPSAETEGSAVSGATTIDLDAVLPDEPFNRRAQTTAKRGAVTPTPRMTVITSSPRQTRSEVLLRQCREKRQRQLYGTDALRNGSPPPLPAVVEVVRVASPHDRPTSRRAASPNASAKIAAVRQQQHARGKGAAAVSPVVLRPQTQRAAKEREEAEQAVLALAPQHPHPGRKNRPWQQQTNSMPPGGVVAKQQGASAPVQHGVHDRAAAAGGSHHRNTHGGTVTGATALSSRRGTLPPHPRSDDEDEDGRASACSSPGGGERVRTSAPVPARRRPRFATDDRSGSGALLDPDDDDDDDRQEALARGVLHHHRVRHAAQQPRGAQERELDDAFANDLVAPELAAEAGGTKGGAFDPRSRALATMARDAETAVQAMLRADSPNVL